MAKVKESNKIMLPSEICSSNCCSCSWPCDLKRKRRDSHFKKKNSQRSWFYNQIEQDHFKKENYASSEFN